MHWRWCRLRSQLLEPNVHQHGSRKAFKHPLHLTVAFLDLFDHVVACETLLELLKLCFPTALGHDSGYFYKLDFELLHDVNKVLRQVRLVQPVAVARRAELPDEIGYLDDIVHDLLPQLAVEIDLTLDLDDLHENARDCSQVRHLCGQGGGLFYHGEGHLKRPHRHIRIGGLEDVPWGREVEIVNRNHAWSKSALGWSWRLA
ncbi:hypothetical protein BJY52DRAFT_1257424 [Lactarius psammicola]|nr:hypothetical protein BJY52DRAFT_1257424 [Lactarius psammicola]